MKITSSLSAFKIGLDVDAKTCVEIFTRIFDSHSAFAKATKMRNEMNKPLFAFATSCKLKAKVSQLNFS